MVNKKVSLRKWQKECYDELLLRKRDGRNHFLAVAGVGSGKTFFSSYVFSQFLKAGEYNSVIVISPTENIKRNWSITFQYDFNIKVDHGYQFKHAWPRDCHGVSLTYQSLNPFNIEVLKRYTNKKVFLIIDEVHHAGDEKSWGEAIQEIGDEAGFVLLLSGTPTRSDNAAIPFVQYKKLPSQGNVAGDKFELQYDYYYGYADSIKDKVCCPTIFPRNSSQAQTFEGVKKLENTFEETPEQKRLFNQILTVRSEGDCYVYQTFLKANEQLSQINDKRNSNYGGLVVCKTIQDAQRLYDRIYSDFGEDFAELVTSDDKDSSKKIEDFKTSYKTWIISINMVSEGVDISRIRCIVYASNVITMVRFMQVMGRGVRNPDHNENDNDVCYMYVPDYHPLIMNAQQIEAEIKHVRQELEESLKKEYVRIEGDQQRLDDIVLSATSDNNGNVYGGSLFNLEEDTDATFMSAKYNVSKDIVLTMWNDILQKAGKPKMQERPVRVETITDEKEKYKRLINTMVGKIHFDHKLDFAEIHFRLNRELGGNKTSNVLTLEELKRKLELAKQLYQKLNSR